MNTDTEWSTREKLAIASYVLRSGEQHWSGVGRLLRPLGEPGRSPEWFSPKFCAQQYTAMMEILEAPKRKRGGERSDSTENLQTVSSPEEMIVNRLTKERIEELKKIVRTERSKYRKLQHEIELVESGALDDKLDEILKRIECEADSDKSESGIAEEPLSSVGLNSATTSHSEQADPTLNLSNIQELAQSAAQEMRQEIEKLHIGIAVKEAQISSEKTQDDISEVSMEIKRDPVTPDTVKDEEMDTIPEVTVNIVDTETEDQTPKETKMSSEKSNENTLSTVEKAIEKLIPAKTSNDRTRANDTFIVPQATNNKLSNNSISSVDDDSAAENQVTSTVTQNYRAEEVASLSKQDPAEGNLSQSANKREENQDIQRVVEDSDCQEHANHESIAERNPEGALATGENAGLETHEEHEPDSSYSMSEDFHQTMSLPGTPVPCGSFTCDSFPSSPALSHSSDMDPDAHTNWKAWRKSIMILWKQVASHRYASLFLQPVTDDIAPNYSDTVYRSMDLATLKKNIESGVVRTTGEFQRDLMLMFQNAIMYNYREHDVYKMTLEMQKDVIDQVEQFVSTQIIAETAQPSSNKSLRRSTIRRAALNEKVSETRSKRAAAIEGEAKFTRKKQALHEN